MIEEKDLLAIGKFQRTHALKGELNALLDIDPEFFEENGEPVIVDMDGCFVPFYLETLRTKGSESYLVQLCGVDTDEKARQFVNKTIYAMREPLRQFLSENGEDLVESEEWHDFKVVDSSIGKLGTVDRIDDSTANILLIVDTSDGNQLYIPLAEEFISGVDYDAKVVNVSLPPELIDLNKKSEE